MSFEGTVNGVHVYSDKDLTRMDGSQIWFADGSRCDVATGEVINRGPGTIQFGQSGGSNVDMGKPSTETKRYNGSGLLLDGLDADVNVEPHDADDYEVTITGPQRMIDKIMAGVRGGRLVISQESGTLGDAMSVVSSGGRSSFSSALGNVFGRSFSSVSFGSVSVGGSPVKILVRAPRMSPITVRSFATGDTKIGNIGGDLDATLGGCGDLTAGPVANLKVESTGTGDVEVRRVDGHAYLVTSGAGDIDIHGGAIGHLVIKTSGTGDVTVSATAQTASLSTSGTGDIEVMRILAKPEKRSTGTGDIDIDHIG